MQYGMTQKQLRYKKTKLILGEGSYKTVTKAVDEEEGKEVAYNELKIKSYEIETNTESSFSKEIAILKTIDHQNILKILDHWFEEENFIFITELMTGGSLREYIDKNGPLGTKLIRKWARQILEGLVYLHTRNPPIIHRDIKNENIFVNAAVGEVKIGDLGLAKERRNKRYTIVGTPNFMAREMFEGEGYTEKVDIYAFGICLIEMATGIRPYSEYDETREIYKSVLQGVFPRAAEQITDPCLKSLILSCLVPIQSRLSSAECLAHHFFHTEITCTGRCVPQECVTVYPLICEPIEEMELSVVSVNGQRVMFQILLCETLKFIKFEYDLQKDSIEKVCSELQSERIIEKESIENFSILLSKGLATIESKIKVGKAHDGLIELNSLELVDMKKRNIVITNRQGEGAKHKIMQECVNEAQSFDEEKHKEKTGESCSTRNIKTGNLMRSRNTAGVALGDSSACAVELTKSVKFKSVPKETGDFPVEPLHGQVPSSLSQQNFNQSSFYCENSHVKNSGSLENLFSSETPTGGDTCINSTSTIPQKLGDALRRLECGSSSGLERALPVSSPPLSGEKTTEEQAVNDISLSESYEIAKAKYTRNHPIAQFVLDAAAITERSEDTAKGWLRVLREEHIESVFDLKLLVYEDWEKLPLTVFSSRAMQNMLYGIEGFPQKEKQLSLNPKIRDYENKMKVREFLSDVCGVLGRNELICVWEGRLLAEDIQTVGELKSLRQEDWSRLGLSVLALRILKNTIQKKGKVLVDDG